MRCSQALLAVTMTGVTILLATPRAVPAEPVAPFERTEQRAACDSYDSLKQPFFGETHLHTSYSFDAYTTSNRNNPDAAYAFAKGGTVELPGPNAMAGVPQTRTAQLRTPLDFAAVTDHSELLGPMQICTRSGAGTTGYDSIQCQQMRTGEVTPGDSSTFNPTAISGLWAINTILRPDGAGPLLPLCAGADCDTATVSMWQSIQQAAEDAYDRSPDCSFTSFVGYEYTAQPLTRNLHRNVIFRNAEVPESPISNVQTGGPHPPVLWQMLRDQCVDAGTGCDVLTIPHNANLSGGLMYPDPADADEAAERAFFEPLTEIYQHKAASECRYDRLEGAGVETKDKLCTFEQAINDVLSPQPNPPDIYNFPPRNMIRNALKEGMALAPDYDGTNPFKYGLIAATDSHNGDPGNTVERDFQGHAGSLDAPVAKMVDSVRLGPGGLAVVWAEENTRDSIFAAMRRKETYATSGTRPTVRFFGGWKFRPGNYRLGRKNLCTQPNPIKRAYRKGVPMGGDLTAGPNARKKPRFYVSALRDTDSAKLQRVQIVKGWVDDDGNTHERVHTVIGGRKSFGTQAQRAVCSKEYGQITGGLKLASLTNKSKNANPNISAKVLTSLQSGANELCVVWKDEDFDPGQRAFYYARVLEMPTCRWSTMACEAAGVNPFASQKACKKQAARANRKAIRDGEIEAGAEPFNNCCLNEKNDPFMERAIQERAWTSPIWYAPAG